jgi:hypothetical protein
MRLHAAVFRVAAPFLLAAGLILHAAPAAAQDTHVDTEVSPSPVDRADRWFDQSVRLFTHMSDSGGQVFLPALSVNPNSGVTWGILPVWILTSSSHTIEHIIAPMVTENKFFGPAFHGTYYYYPSADSKFRAVLEKASRVNGRAALRYEDEGFLNDRCVFKADSNLEEDGTPRFYGLGPTSPEGKESSYRLKEGLAQTELGVKVREDWRMSLGWEFRRTEVLPGFIPTPAAFDTSLLATSNYSLPRIGLSRDTRDHVSTPNRGSLTELYTEFSRRALGSDASFQRYGGQWRLYVPESQAWTTALHAQSTWSDGQSLPFTALTTLGGPQSLRGFPEGRFQDRGAVFGNVEERWTVHSVSVVNTLTEFQVAPFLDVGTVFSRPQAAQAKYVQPVVGMAMRAVVKPTVVGRVEVGTSREGPATFMGIDYPF